MHKKTRIEYNKLLKNNSFILAGCKLFLDFFKVGAVFRCTELKDCHIIYF